MYAGRGLRLRDTADLHAERVYCGHIRHSGLLRKYTRESPFPLERKIRQAEKLYLRYYLIYLATKLL